MSEASSSPAFSQSVPASGAVRDQLDRVLSSAQFLRSERLRRLLSVIVESGLRGDVGALKETVLGRQAYDRGADFDSRTDPIVRTEMRRLRRKLVEYYGSAGRADPVVIEIPKGKYVPAFRTREPFASRLQGQTLGPYQVVERLGAGPSGITYRVIDPATGSEFAARQLPSDIAMRPEAISSLQADSETAAALHSENACRIEAVEETLDGVLLCSKFHEGITLEERMLTGALEWPECETIARQLVSVLAKAHESGVVHGRLKPSGILLSSADREVRVTVLNFGTRLLAARLVIRSDGRQLGTAGYESCHATADRDSDVRSLGAILCQLFTRALPLVQADRRPTILPFMHDVPERHRAALARLIAGCLTQSASDRYPDAMKIAAAYAQIFAESEPARETRDEGSGKSWKKLAKRLVSMVGFTTPAL